MLNAKKSIPPLVSCPSGNQTTLQRTSTMNSGSASPTNSSIFRHNSISNVMHNFDQNLNNNQNRFVFSFVKFLYFACLLLTNIF
jgi:hypothetical protein